MDPKTLIAHKGGCHCKNIRWEVDAPSSVTVWKCNCTDCSMRGNIHFIVPSVRFKLIGDCEKFIATYTFGTHTAKHTFCNVYGIAVTVNCVDPGTLTHVEIKHFDGRNWDRSYDQTSIASCSKLQS
ncbi:hypothetical protein MKW94_019781 [Papaver nudicaule]|uniref:CENP-V/GFA domain-containing protein n=1 Tax=Papaver nudicaule TaxID=74823 RepID=A0AA41V5Z2_PAPNU|nr:hypothetical protein [Papaver nudicaule]